MIAFACGETDTIQIPLYSSINELNQSFDDSFFLSPNPASEEVFCRFSIPVNSDHTRLKLLDITGRVLFDINLAPGMNEFRIPISKYASGTYFVEVELMNIGKFSRMFLKN
jgi:hypothetical protein